MDRIKTLQKPVCEYSRPCPSNCYALWSYARKSRSIGKRWTPRRTAPRPPPPNALAARLCGCVADNSQRARALLCPRFGPRAASPNRGFSARFLLDTHHLEKGRSTRHSDTSRNEGKLFRCNETVHATRHLFRPLSTRHSNAQIAVRSSCYFFPRSCCLTWNCCRARLRAPDLQQQSAWSNFAGACAQLN